MTRRKSKNIVSLRGGALPVPTVNADVVAILNALMDQARDGQIAGLIYGTVAPEGHVTTGWEGNADSHGMVAAAAKLFHRVMNQ